MDWGFRKNKYLPVIRPIEGWLRGFKANFVIAVPRTEADPDWYLTLIPPKYKAELWLQKKKDLYTLRVSKDFKEEVSTSLRHRGFRYHTQTRTWRRYKRFKMEWGNSSSL
jgi:hypothetical protein